MKVTRLVIDAKANGRPLAAVLSDAVKSIRPSKDFLVPFASREIGPRFAADLLVENGFPGEIEYTIFTNDGMCVREALLNSEPVNVEGVDCALYEII